MLSLRCLDAISSSQRFSQPGRSFGSLLTYSSCARSVSVIGTLRRGRCRGAGFCGFCGSTIVGAASAMNSAAENRRRAAPAENRLLVSFISPDQLRVLADVSLHRLD